MSNNERFIDLLMHSEDTIECDIESIEHKQERKAYLRALKKDNKLLLDAYIKLLFSVRQLRNRTGSKY